MGFSLRFYHTFCICLCYLSCVFSHHKLIFGYMLMCVTIGNVQNFVSIIDIFNKWEFGWYFPPNTSTIWTRIICSVDKIPTPSWFMKLICTNRKFTLWQHEPVLNYLSLQYTKLCSSTNLFKALKTMVPSAAYSMCPMQILKNLNI